MGENSSFDVFGQCFTTVCGGSYARLSRLAQRIYELRESPPSAADIEDFFAVRMEAESWVHQQGKPVTLEAIWRRVYAVTGWDSSSSLDCLEREVFGGQLIPVDSVKAQVDNAREAGQSITFISCSPFSETFVQEQLVQHGFYASGDGLTIHHEGDGAGLSFSLLEKFSKAETEVLKTGPGLRLTAEHLAGVMRSLRVTGVDGCSEMYAELSSQFMAPFTTVFVCWVLAAARERGIDRLYFLSRDCQLTLEAAQRLSPEFGAMDCRYLQVSRQSLFLPSTLDLSEEGLHWLFEEQDEHVLKCLLAKIELSYEEVAPFFLQAAEEGEEYVLKTADDRKAFWSALRQPEIHEPLVKLIRKRREAAHRYFEGEGLFDSVKWAVVDIGWFLNCQRALTTLMKSWGREDEVHGFYLGVQQDRQPRRETGSVDSLFYRRAPNEMHKSVEPAVFKFIILIENLFGTADHPSVHHYELDEEGGAKPAFVRSVPPKTVERFRALEKGYIEFAERSRSFARELSDSVAAASLIEELTLYFLNKSGAKMLKPLKEIEVAFGQDHFDPFPLVRPLTVREALVPIFPSWSCLQALRRGPHVMWHRGSVEVSSAKIRALYALAYRIRSIRIRVKFLR